MRERRYFWRLADVANGYWRRDTGCAIAHGRVVNASRVERNGGRARRWRCQMLLAALR